MASFAETFAWSKQNTDYLIQLYEEHASLWDTSASDYYKRDLRTRAWSQICIELGMPDTPECIDCVNKKMSNLRTYYNRERSKVKASKKNSADADDVYKSTWMFYNQLNAFLSDSINPRKGMPNLDVPGSDDENEASNDYENDPSFESESMQNSLMETPKVLKRKAAERLDSTIKNMRSEGLLINEAVPFTLKTIAHATEDHAKKQDDPEDIFGKHVANELRMIPNIRARQMAKLQIQKMLFEAQFGAQT